jgi:hypothetical protein
MEEELEMSKLGFKVEGTPEQRYAKIPIAGFSLRGDDGRETDRPVIAAERLCGPHPEQRHRVG